MAFLSLVIKSYITKYINFQQLLLIKIFFIDKYIYKNFYIFFYFDKYMYFSSDF